jgi:hypothetical protein
MWLKGIWLPNDRQMLYSLLPNPSIFRQSIHIYNLWHDSFQVNYSNMERTMKESPMEQRNSESEFSDRNSQEMRNHRQSMVAMVQQLQGDIMND